MKEIWLIIIFVGEMFVNCGRFEKVIRRISAQWLEEPQILCSLWAADHRSIRSLTFAPKFNKMTKNIILVLMLLASLMTVSCQSEDETTQTSNTEFAEFANAYNETMSDVFSIGVGRSGNGNGPRKSIVMLPDSLRQVYLQPGDKYQPGEQFTGTTLVELVQFSDAVNGTVAMFNDGTAIDSMTISETEAREKLDPMVEQAWKYLRGKGMTDSEINAMLEENNADETALVPLMIALMEYEGCFDESVVAQAPSMNPNQPFQDKQFDYKQAALCVVKILGGDLIDEILSSGTQAISKKFIIKTFKKVAKRYVGGPVAVAIAVIDFADCMGYI